MMASLLKQDDFQLAFGAPVDCDEYPGYLAVVQRPMDLGTIRSECLGLLEGPVLQQQGHMQRGGGWRHPLHRRVAWQGC